jgi:1-acyl-sn-glycerol-3-phosphate acyltransferase
MGWTEIADALWSIRPWMLPVLAAIYLIPLARLIGYPLEYGGRFFMPINKCFGQWEHVVMRPRDTVLTLYLSGAIIWHAFVPAGEMSEWMHALAALVAALLIAASALQASFRRRGHEALIEFTRQNPNVHPQEFFDHLLCCSGIIRHVLPKQPFKTVDHFDMDFTGGKRGFIKKRKLLCGAWSTFWLGRLMVLSARIHRGAKLGRTAAALALVWAARVAQLARARVTVEERERILPGKAANIFLFDHMSFIDFALATIALAAVPTEGRGGKKQPSIPLFLLAKDHFLDNPIYHRLLGIGMAAEALGMIFVDRRGPGESDRAKDVSRESTRKLLSYGGGLAIYPQGSRGAPYIDRDGKRLDSAYYTVGSRDRIKRDGAHLKKGAAFIATEAALELAQSSPDEEVRLVPVAIFGTGIACPKGTPRVLSNVHIRLRFGETISLSPAHISGMSSPEGAEPMGPEEDAYFDFVQKLHSRIDVVLKTAAHVHANLERRFFEDIRDMLDALQHEEIAVAIKPWRGDDYLFHAILDAIYACPPAKWRTLHGELIHMLLNFATRTDLLAFKARVADEITSCRDS